MKSPALATAVTVLAAALALPSAAAAQDYLGAYQDAQQFQRQLQNMQDNAATGNDAEEADDAQAGQPRSQEALPAQAGHASPGLAALDFQPSPAVTARVNRALAAALIGGDAGGGSGAVEALGQVLRDDPRLRDLLAEQLGRDLGRIVQALDSGVLQRRFAERLEARGYSAHNVADVNNAFLIHAWGLIHGAGFDAPGLYAAQRERSRRSLAAGPTQAPMADEHKQDLSETLAALVMLSGAAWARNADPGSRAVVQDGMARIARMLGIDLHRARVTANGLASS